MIKHLAMVVAAGALALPASLQQRAEAPVATRLQTELDRWRAESGVPGATVGVVLGDGTSLGLASGVSDRGRATPIKPTDLMLAGSTGKTFFAAVAVQMIESRQLDLDAPISRYLGDRPWLARIANAEAITVRHLMTHTSGIVRYEMNPAFTSQLVAEPDRAWSPEEEVAFLLDAPAPFAPGQGWEYSDTNYIVIGMILEGLLDRPVYDEVARRFLGPLGLTEVRPSTSRRIPGLIPGYAGPNDPLGLPDEVLVDGQFVINPQFEWTGGGYATSAPDLARWGHALYRGDALTASARARMIDAAVPARLGPEIAYGLGVIVRSSTPVGTTWGHSGFFPGYLSELIHVTDSGVTLAVQVNSSARRAPGSRSPLRLLFDLAAALK
jgi:D-alanyl-D-alanine carboxypeptidase